MRKLLWLGLLFGCAHSAPTMALRDSGPAQRDLARTADATVHREDPEKGPSAAASLAKEHGGWVAAMNDDRVDLRVPDGQLDAVLAALPSLGEVAERRIRASDVTDAHRDLLVRIDNLRRTRDRYLALLDQAENVSEATGVEKELERVTALLEVLEAQQKALEQRVEFASLSVEFSRKVRPGPIGWVFYGLYAAVKWAL